MGIDPKQNVVSLKVVFFVIKWMDESTISPPVEKW
jgi:hypothetical protein